MQISSAALAFSRLVRETGFGTIRNFRLSGGVPLIDANTEVSVEYRLSGVEQAKEVPSDEDYLKKPQVRTMLQKFAAVGTGVVELLDVRDGLPFRMVIRRRAIL